MYGELEVKGAELAADEGRNAAALAACRTLAEELTELQFPAPRILAFKEGSSESRYFVSRLIPAHKDPPYKQEANFHSSKHLTTEQWTKLKSSFVHFDDPSFCEWIRNLKVVPPEKRRSCRRWDLNIDLLGVIEVDDMAGVEQRQNKSGGGKYFFCSGGKKKEVKKETGLGLSFTKDENFGEWYSEVVVNGEMIEYYDISGCYILRPWAISIWEIMQTFFDAEIKKMKVKNCYFPLFVSPGVLQKEKDHIEGFAPEVAWVTKSGESELEVPIAIRPTSETVMYPYYSKWIRGHRDLPLKLNQWCNVVRWEFSNPTPFIRSREFLWQEGHTAFATKEEADTEVLQILELYRCIYEEFLAIPVTKGRKSELETFAGGLYTTSVEAFIPNTGRGIQGATSHCLGQNFAKMFEINFENEKGEKGMVWQNSWAYSTRTIGVMVMVHGDDKGLVLPPKVAALQLIVIPVPYKDADTQGIFDACVATVATLSDAGIRAEADLRDNYSPGWKYSNWEMKGVPLRIEIGPRDLANNQVRAVRRDNGAKTDISRVFLVEQVKGMLDKIQQNLFDVAKQKRDACVEVLKTWEEFVTALGQKKLILAPWCDEEDVEKDVKARTKGDMGAAKSLCTPFEQPELPEGTKCFASGKPAKKWTYWGRSY
ncbi:proline--tRNA ligase, cytoplasmic-like isoform X5 [Durio zibethinus]|uniref:proline--tRNA ligase n=1 Tax=Durio zibethinus TaxID=66656 RepID=A0A6P5XYG0_DURZI|nr:proline--tRNA ligase, cytoplasmic-like isoform X5 [Durio zibethinus]